MKSIGYQENLPIENESSLQNIELPSPKVSGARFIG